MISFIKKIKNYLILAVLVLIAGGVGVYAWVINGQNAPQYQPFEVKKVQLSQSVTATGYLQPATSVDLAFHTSGEVDKVLVDVGQRVKTGDVLASLVNSSQKATLAQNKGILAQAQANLNLKLASAPDQDIAVAKAAVKSAAASEQKSEVSYQNAITDLNNTQKTVAADTQTAQIDLQTAQLNLQKVMVNSATATQQSASSLTNANQSLKTAMGDLLVASKGLLQNVDKIFGLQGLPLSTVSQPNISTAGNQYFDAQNFYTQNLQTYQQLQSQFDALSANPSNDDLMALSSGISDFIHVMNDGVLALSTILDRTYTTASFSYSDLVTLRTQITTAGGSFDAAAAVYDAAKQAMDSAVIAQSGTGSSSPLDIQSAQLQVTQQQQNLDKVTVNGQTEISAKQMAVQSAQADMKIAQSSVDQANAQLDKLLASPRAVDVAPYQAQVKQAKAQVDKAQSDYDDTMVTAPFDGIITSKNINPGDQFLAAGGLPGSPALQIIDDSQFHIDVNVPETQIARISNDSKVSVTFDALGTDTVFDGKILLIEPASTQVQDVIYYIVKVALTKNDPRLKSGMSANVTIGSENVSNVLAIPEKAITLDPNNNKTVMTGPDKSVTIQTGAKGNDGMIEVVSGLNEGDTIFVPVN
jgi:multidrug efflux pump subunit AcrA (membrane-fusion protein)